MPTWVQAQQPGQGAEAPWPAPAIGVRFGYDQAVRGEIIGGQLRIPILSNARAELVPSADITFLTGLRDYGFNVDAVYVSGGLQGGVYLGGGVSLRNSIFTSDESGRRETKTGVSGVVGVKGGGPGPLQTQVEFRWTFLRGVDYEPRAITLGVNFPFWGRPTGR